METTINIAMIEKERARKGWTKKQMAAEMGITRQGLHDLFRRPPTLRTIYRLMAVMKLPMGAIVTMRKDQGRAA